MEKGYKGISVAINNVMQEVNNIEKNTTVGFGNNSYKATSEGDVKRAIRNSMIKNGLSILQTGVEGDIKIDRWEEMDTYKKVMKTKQSVFTDVTTKYLLIHISGESIELAGYGQGIDTQDKGAGKATTYALKNTLINIFLIPTGEDTDNTHSDDIPVPQKKVIPVKKPKFTTENFEVMKEKTNYTNYFEAKQNIDAKYELDLQMAKKVKSYYEALDKGVDFGKDGTAPF